VLRKKGRVDEERQHQPVGMPMLHLERLVPPVKSIQYHITKEECQVRRYIPKPASRTMKGGGVGKKKRKQGTRKREGEGRVYSCGLA